MEKQTIKEAIDNLRKAASQCDACGAPAGSRPLFPHQTEGDCPMCGTGSVAPHGPLAAAIDAVEATVEQVLGASCGIGPAAKLLIEKELMREEMIAAVTAAVDDAWAEGNLDEGRNWKQTLDAERTKVAAMTAQRDRLANLLDRELNEPVNEHPEGYSRFLDACIDAIAEARKP